MSSELGKRKAMDLNAIVRKLLRANPGMFIKFSEFPRRKKVLLKIKRHRISQSREANYWTGEWAKWMLDPRAKEPGTFQFKQFRNKFRMPCKLFVEDFIPAVREHKIFPQKYNGGKQIPVEIKCMIALRILGRGSYADDMSEMSKVKPSTCNHIFKTFVKNMAAKMFPVYVTPPKDDHLRRVLDTYARLGFPGAVGSVDCTHIFWDKCPVALSNLCKGKEKFPSLSFEVVVDHDRRIHSCTDGFVGTAPDSVIVVNDEYCRSIAEGRFKDLKYSLYKEDGSFVTVEGGYLISDGGYPRHWMFQRPAHNAVTERSVLWSEYLESVRKDVECTFGNLKQRFHFLKHFVKYHTAELMSNAMKTCCVLHNMLLAWDSGSRDDWECRREDWENIEADFYDKDLERPDTAAALAARLAASIEAEKAAKVPRSETGMGLVPPTDGAGTIVGATHRHKALQDALQIHFQFAYKRGAVVWPKGFTAHQRADFKLERNKARRVNNVFYKAPSFLRTNNGEHKVGLGLFSCIGYAPGNRLIKFIGIVRTREEYTAREEAGKGGYCLHLSNDSVLDCYDTRDVCYASHANNASNCHTLQASFQDAVAGVDGLWAAQNNCKLRVDRTTTPATVWLVATAVIPPHREILFPYGPLYRFPAV